MLITNWSRWPRERGGEGVEGPANATRRVTLFNCQHFDGQCSHTHSHKHTHSTIYYDFLFLFFFSCVCMCFCLFLEVLFLPLWWPTCLVIKAVKCVWVFKLFGIYSKKHLSNCTLRVERVMKTQLQCSATVQCHTTQGIHTYAYI